MGRPLKCTLGWHVMRKGHCINCDFVDFGHYSKF